MIEKKFTFFDYLPLISLFIIAMIFGCQPYKVVNKTNGQVDAFSTKGTPYLIKEGKLSLDTSNPLEWTDLNKFASPKSNAALRKIQSLNGIWQVEEGDWDTPPSAFGHQVPVPGLMDMATPKFEFPLIDPSKFTAVNPAVEFAPTTTTRSQVPIIVDDKREAFWYKKTFRYAGEKPAVVILKIYKAKYHTTVWLNGKKIGENPHNFAPGYFDVTKALKKDGQNELVIRIGASMSGYQGKGTYMDGFDVEKTRFYPGIYDKVELISSGSSKITRCQIAPDLDGKKIKVAVWLNNIADKTINEPLLLQITDSKDSNNILKTIKTLPIAIPAATQKQVYVEIPFAAAKLWSPENPNLYNLRIKTSNDELESRFGMRTFKFDEVTKLPTLNGQTRFLRGSNICFFRFAEDPTRGDKAWDEVWVRRVFKKIKSMNWNVVRFCIGPPPEFWYRIADEEGVMVVDEAPIWTLFRALNLKKEVLVREYTAQLQAHWNYPCVIFWDAQNETPLSPQTLAALKEVRGIDMSNRAWDNGWGAPDRPTDPYEEHVYAHFASFNNAVSPMYNMNTLDSLGYQVGFGFHDGLDDHPLLINEYGWLWLQRDGTPTKLTEKGYAAHLPNSTVTERFEFWNYRLAAITESMRARRVEGVFHFTVLSHSYAGCFTADNFIDLESLDFEPHFEKYAKSAN